jgi:hypothetical protein
LYMPVSLVNVTIYERNEIVKKILRGVFKYLKTKMSSKGYREQQRLQKIELLHEPHLS